MVAKGVGPMALSYEARAQARARPGALVPSTIVAPSTIAAPSIVDGSIARCDPDMVAAAPCCSRSGAIPPCDLGFNEVLQPIGPPLKLDPAAAGAFAATAEAEPSVSAPVPAAAATAATSFPPLRRPHAEPVAAASASAVVAAPLASKRGRCIADGCTADLSTLSKYHQRNRICLAHIRADSFLLNGSVVRFCQRCGHSHGLEAFDLNRHSCREQLAKHNARRRQATAARRASASQGTKTSAVPLKRSASRTGGRAVATATAPVAPVAALAPASGQTSSDGHSSDQTYTSSTLNASIASSYVAGKAVPMSAEVKDDLQVSSRASRKPDANAEKACKPCRNGVEPSSSLDPDAMAEALVPPSPMAAAEAARIFDWLEEADWVGSAQTCAEGELPDGNDATLQSLASGDVAQVGAALGVPLPDVDPVLVHAEVGIKVFDARPNDLPQDLCEQARGWFSFRDVESLEASIEPGCVILTVRAGFLPRKNEVLPSVRRSRVSAAASAQAAAAMAAHVAWRMLATSDDFWRRRNVMVRVGGSVLLISDGSIRRQWHETLVTKAPNLSTLVGWAGAGMTLEVSGDSEVPVVVRCVLRGRVVAEAPATQVVSACGCCSSYQQGDAAPGRMPSDGGGCCSGSKASVPETRQSCICSVRWKAVVSLPRGLPPGLLHVLPTSDLILGRGPRPEALFLVAGNASDAAELSSAPRAVVAAVLPQLGALVDTRWPARSVAAAAGVLPWLLRLGLLSPSRRAISLLRGFNEPAWRAPSTRSCKACAANALDVLAAAAEADQTIVSTSLLEAACVCLQRSKGTLLHQAVLSGDRDCVEAALEVLGDGASVVPAGLAPSPLALAGCLARVLPNASAVGVLEALVSADGDSDSLGAVRSRTRELGAVPALEAAALEALAKRRSLSGIGGSCCASPSKDRELPDPGPAQSLLGACCHPEAAPSGSGSSGSQPTHNLAERSRAAPNCGPRAAPRAAAKRTTGQVRGSCCGSKTTASASKYVVKLAEKFTEAAPRSLKGKLGESIELSSPELTPPATPVRCKCPSSCPCSRMRVGCCSVSGECGSSPGDCACCASHDPFGSAPSSGGRDSFSGLFRI